MTIEIGKIRNVGVVGHGGVGKTSLVEAMLFAAGAVNRLGRVDDGTTTTDFDPDEIKRKISINTSVAHCDWKGHHLNLIDTPGYGDFIADARAGLRVVEAAVVVVDAVSGVQVQTEKVWKFATEFNLPRAVVINRLDRERAIQDAQRLLARLEGMWTAPEAAALVAALIVLKERRDVAADTRVVLILTGTGFKCDPPPLPAPTDLSGTDDAIVEHVTHALTR